MKGADQTAGKKSPPLKLSIKNCTDVIYLIMLIILIAAIVIPAAMGNYGLVRIGKYDSDHNLCGHGDLEDYPYLVSAPVLELSEVPGFKGQKEFHDLRSSYCVKECLSENTEYECYPLTPVNWSKRLNELVKKYSSTSQE